MEGDAHAMTGSPPPRSLRRAQFFAALDDLSMLSRSGTVDEARELATQRAKLTKTCGVFRLDANGITLVESVYPDGTAQPPLFTLKPP